VPKLEITHVPKQSTLDEILASDDTEELKKIRIKGLFLTMFSNSLHIADGNASTLAHNFLNTVEAL